MGFRTKKRRRRLEREVRLTKLRESRRLARQGKFYDTNKQSLSLDNVLGSEPTLNSRFRATRPALRQNLNIEAPERLNLDANLGETLSFIQKLRKEWLFGDHARVMIDHSGLESISAGAATLMLAEIDRCARYANVKKSVHGNYPNSEKAAQLLTDIGFYRFLHIPAPGAGVPAPLIFFKIVSGKVSDSRYANSLIDQLNPKYPLGGIPRRRIYGALVECMDNVFEHAYQRRSFRPDLIGQWWLTGYYDPENGLTSIVFLDQGLGIPTTLKRRQAKGSTGRLFKSDSDVIEVAVLEGASSKASKTRGTGLPSMKAFTDQLSDAGHLRVLSNRGDFRYEKGGKSFSGELETGYDGTLILWSIRPNKADGKRLVS